MTRVYALDLLSAEGDLISTQSVEAGTLEEMTSRCRQIATPLGVDQAEADRLAATAWTDGQAEIGAGDGRRLTTMIFII